jgi:hypothetical protein
VGGQDSVPLGEGRVLEPKPPLGVVIAQPSPSPDSWIISTLFVDIVLVLLYIIFFPSLEYLHVTLGV